MTWLKWWESPVRPWSVSVFNRLAHCLDAEDSKERSVPAQRGVLVHDFFEAAVKQMAAGVALDLSDQQTISELLTQLADHKNFGNDVYDQAMEMILRAVENDIFADLTLSEAIGIEIGIAMEPYVAPDGEYRLQVIPWHDGWEYDAPEEMKKQAPAAPWYRGKIDRAMVRRDQDGKVRAYVLDYKTSLNMEDDEAFQRLPNGKIYCWAFDKYLRQVKNIVVDEFVYRHVYVRYNNARRGIIIKSQDLPIIEEKILARVEDRINRRSRARVRGPYCKYCKFMADKSCTVGETYDLAGKTVEEKMVELNNAEVYHKQMMNQCIKEKELLLKEKGGDTQVIETNDLIFRLEVTPKRKWTMGSILKFTEEGQKLADKLDLRGKPITVDDVAQIKSSSCNEERMPHVVEKVGEVEYYVKNGKGYKKGDMKKKASLRAVQVGSFLDTSTE